MSKIKVIKTEKDYEEALKLAETLMNHNPDPDSEEGEQLNLLSTLIKDYEVRILPEELPSSIDAIKFRMEQAGLKPIDLVPYIGSRSRVSEVFSGKRQLTLDMVRALEAGLGIPAKVLIQKPETDDSEYHNWDNRLIAEMAKRKYFDESSLGESSKTELLKNFFAPIGSPTYVFGMLRKSNYRSSPLTDRRALTAWATQVIKKAKEIAFQTKYKHGTINLEFMQNLAKLLSTEVDGPIRVREYLKKYGITLIVEPHFPKTYLDGATILVDKNNPIVGLTLRYDRLDNFWFTLMHELAHISLHYSEGINLFYDEIEGIKNINLDEKERDADWLAEEALLPKAKWEISPARLIPSSMAANSLAKELGVHIAIIAGQIRYRGNKYVYLSKIVNREKVRKYFPEEKWGK